MPITNANYTSPDWTGYPYPSSLAPLPDWMSRGLSVLSAFSLLSATTSVTLFSYITYLFIRDRASARKNQYVVLIYCLLIADFQLATGFLISFKFLHDNEIYAPSAACTAQAWLTNLGDLASGLFILAIAAHTFLAVVFGRRLEFFTFCSVVIGLWVVSVVITATPIMLHPSDIFVVGGNWCTINPKYDSLRLYCHYLWIFLAEFLVLFLYAVTFIILRHRMGGIVAQFSDAKKGKTNSSTTSNGRSTTRDVRTDRKMSLAAIYMILYPVVYIIVTLPLAAGRIASMAGNKPSLNYLLIGGSFMTSAGWIDCLLYSLTRRAFLARTVVSTTGAAYRFGMRSGNSKSGRSMELTPTTGYREIPSRAGGLSNARHEGDRLEIVPSSNGVKVETTWEVRTNCRACEADVNELQHKTHVSAERVHEETDLDWYREQV